MDAYQQVATVARVGDHLDVVEHPPDDRAGR